MRSTDFNGNPPKRDMCDCGILYRGHPKCPSCKILIHTDELMGEIGYSTNGINCTKHPPDTKSVKPRKPETAEHLENRKKKQRDLYAQDPVYREQIRARSRKYYEDFNQKFLSPPMN